MEIAIKDNGKMIKLMDMGYINMPMELGIKVNGKMIDKMEKV